MQYVIELIKSHNNENELLWLEIAKLLSKEPGYSVGRLLKSVDPTSNYGMIGISVWDSLAHYHAAMKTCEIKSQLDSDLIIAETQSSPGKEQDLSSTECAILINPFEVESEEEDDCLKMWNEAADSLSECEGFVSTNLCKSVVQDSKYRYVNIAEWDSAKSFINAVGRPEFLQIPRLLDFPHHPTICQSIKVILPLSAQTNIAKPTTLQQSIFSSQNKSPNKDSECESESSADDNHKPDKITSEEQEYVPKTKSSPN